MKSKVFCGMGLCAAVAVSTVALAGPPLKLVGWSEYNPRWIQPPPGLPELSEIEGGGAFVVGITKDSSLVGWGYFSHPSSEFFIPAGIDKVMLVRASATAVLVVKSDGSIRVWGYSGVQSLDLPPAEASGAIDAALGESAAIALTPTGEVVVWGAGEIVSEMPTDLGPCVDVFAYYHFAAAVTVSGEVRCWGDVSSSLPCDPPGTRLPVDAFFSNDQNNAALLSDGSVAAWGNYSGQTSPPPATELVNCVKLDATGQGQIFGAIRADGTAFVWGIVNPGAGIPVPQPGAIRELGLCGIRTFALIDEFTDCNANGLDDSAEIEADTELDCNGDWIPDTCQFAEGVVEDCNGNGIADACEKATPFDATSANLGPIGFGSPQTWTVDELPAAASHATLSVTAKGDFSSVSEYVVVRLNGDAIGVAFIDGADCTEIGPESITISAATFNALVDPDGAASFTFEPTIAVNANAGPGGTWIAASLTYNGATDLDCNANGLLDSCEIAEGYAEDCNLDGIPDSCQDTTADCNANRVWDACDIASGAAVDCNGNGVPDLCDIGSGAEGDCNGNGQFDECEIADGSVPDCNDNGVPDSCDLAAGMAPDCNANGIPDACDIASGTSADCNANGTPDSCDIASGTAADINGNGIPDSCEGLLCPGDLNDDHAVTGADLAILLGFWGPVGAFPKADIDGSGVVDAGDLAILLGGWGACP